MTSGTFTSLPIDGIKIEPGRQRKELRNIPVLADSIKRLGLIHPIVVTREGVLVAGERRLSAAKLLGFRSIHAQFLEDLDPANRRAIELEENIKRENITWKEECLAVAEYHTYRKGLVSDWTETKTAEALGLSKQTVNEKIQVAAALERPAVAAADKFSVARGLVARAESRRADEEVASLSATAVPPVAPQSDKILCADFREWALDYAGPRFNLIHCDFPYGIGADQRQQGVNHETIGSYDDTQAVYWGLCDTLARSSIRITESSCHLVFWFSMTHYTETLRFLSEETPFDINPHPLVWMKSDNVGLLPDPERGPRRVYETAFLGSRGDRRVVRAVANAFHGPTVRSRHMSEKPQAVLEHFFRMLVDDSTVLLDPTCGSGSALRAARAAGAKDFLGLEINPDYARSAARLLEEKDLME